MVGTSSLEARQQALTAELENPATYNDGSGKPMAINRELTQVVESLAILVAVVMMLNRPQPEPSAVGGPFALVDQTGQALLKISDQVSQLTELVREIAAAAGDQSTGLAQINETVNEMDKVTQQNAAMVEQLSATAKSLASQVDNVNNSMRMFRLQAGEVNSQPDAVALRRQNRLPG